jgi:hypothetical protein
MNVTKLTLETLQQDLNYKIVFIYLIVFSEQHRWYSTEYKDEIEWRIEKTWNGQSVFGVVIVVFVWKN